MTPPALGSSSTRFLPDDGYAGTLVARMWRPEAEGPSVVALREHGVYDVTAEFPTVSGLLERPEPVRALRESTGERVGSLEDILANSDETRRDPRRPFFLAPCDLQVVKAAGVTFAASLIERVIEEQADGDPAKAQQVRARVVAQIGTDLSTIKPGSEQASHLKQLRRVSGPSTWRMASVPMPRYSPRRRCCRRWARARTSASARIPPGTTRSPKSCWR